jgi:transposase
MFVHTLAFSTDDSVTIGAKLIYLPPYLPNLNPIKQSFSSIKAWLIVTKTTHSGFRSTCT